MSKPSPAKNWFPAVADKVARLNLSLRAAAMEEGIALTGEEADRVSKQKAWQDALWAARHRFQTEVAQSPGATQTSLVGLAYVLIQELIKAGDFDKALDGIQKLARLRGWDKSQELNLFANITTADLDAQRKAIEKEIHEQSVGPVKSPAPN